MSWAAGHIEKLLKGETVSFRPRGPSMEGKISSGQLVTVAPITDQTIEVGDIVLCKVRGKHFLHLVKAISDERFQIGNNRGFINGWITKNSIYGKCIAIAD